MMTIRFTVYEACGVEPTMVGYDDYKLWIMPRFLDHSNATTDFVTVRSDLSGATTAEQLSGVIFKMIEDRCHLNVQVYYKGESGGFHEDELPLDVFLKYPNIVKMHAYVVTTEQ